MINRILLAVITIFLCSCGGSGSNTSSTKDKVPSTLIPPREVSINLPEKLTVDEKSTLKIDFTISGPVLPSDKLTISTDSISLSAHINSERNAILIQTIDVLRDTEVMVKIAIEGPLNHPSRNIQIQIINVSGNSLVKEIINNIDKIKEHYNYREELHIANMLSIISPLKYNEPDIFTQRLVSFKFSLESTLDRVNKIVAQYKAAIEKYTNKEIDEEQLVTTYKMNNLSNTDYNFEKMRLLNVLLLELEIKIEFPIDTENMSSNFIGNSMLGKYTDGKFIFNTKYFYLNNILDISCVEG